MLDEHRVDRQIVTLTTPGTHVETPARAADLAKLVNDAFAEVVATRGSHFSALATLPLNDPGASARELERAMTSLHLPGAMLFSNVNGVALADERFWPALRSRRTTWAPCCTSTRITPSASRR